MSVRNDDSSKCYTFPMADKRRQKAKREYLKIEEYIIAPYRKISPGS
jgi:hypothetical protein